MPLARIIYAIAHPITNYILRYKLSYLYFLILILSVLLPTGIILAQDSKNTQAVSDQVITFYVREYPNFKVIPEKVTQKILDYTKQHHKTLIPGELAELEQRLMLKKLTPPASDIDLFAIHAGFISRTDQNGQLTLPRKIQNDTIKLIITPSLMPVFSANNNIAYWNLDPNQPAQAFTITKKLDPLTEQLYWDVQPAPLLPNQPISTQALIIIGDPKVIYLPTDLTPTTDDIQLLLPDIYIKNLKTNSNLAKQNLIKQTINNLLNTLNIRAFYGPTKKIYKRTPYGIASQTIT
jgi:hypothetical protein